MPLQEDKHIKRIVENKTILSGGGPARLKEGQIAIQKYGSDRRLVFRDDNNDYHEAANRNEIYNPTGAQGLTGVQGIPAPPAGATGVINFVLGGGNAVVSTGSKGSVVLPFDLQIDSWRLTAGETGSIAIGLWRSSYADYPPTSTAAMHNGSTGPYIVSGIKNEKTDLSDWAGNTGTMGDHVLFNVDSVDLVKLCSLALNFHRLL